MIQRTLLFVCVHNSGRSQLAEALANALARRKGIPVRAMSAGTGRDSVITAILG